MHAYPKVKYPDEMKYPKVVIPVDYRIEIIKDFVHGTLKKLDEESKTMRKGANITHMVIKSFLTYAHMREMTYMMGSSDFDHCRFITLDGEAGKKPDEDDNSEG